MPEVVKFAKSNGIDVAITTNGVMLTEKISDEILEHLSWIKISLDAGTKESHSKIHGCSKDDFQKIIDNLTYAVKLRKKKNYKCTIGTQLLILEENVDEIEILAKILKGIGVDYLVLKPYSQHPDSINEKSFDLSKYDDYLVRLSEKYSDSSFKLTYRQATGNEIQSGKIKYDVCYGIDFFAIIDAHGNIVPCHIFHEKDKFYYGNINEDLFSSIWKSDKRKKIVESIRKKGCSECRIGCRMNFANKYLFDLKEDKITHVNFI
jgi:radical SAM protein with 4Fe4S-binding SPASM domain